MLTDALVRIQKTPDGKIKIKIWKAIPHANGDYSTSDKSITHDIENLPLVWKGIVNQKVEELINGVREL